MRHKETNPAIQNIVPKTRYTTKGMRTMSRTAVSSLQTASEQIPVRTSPKMFKIQLIYNNKIKVIHYEQHAQQKCHGKLVIFDNDLVVKL